MAASFKRMSTNILHPYLIESRTGEMFKGQARVKVSGVCMWSGILKEELTFQSFTLYLFLSIMLKFSTQIITDNSINYHMISFFIQSRLLSAFYLHIAQQLVPLHDVSEPKFLLMLIMMLVLKFGRIIEAEVWLRFWRVWSRFWSLRFVEFQRLKFGQANKVWFWLRSCVENTLIFLIALPLQDFSSL